MRKKIKLLTEKLPASIGTVLNKIVPFQYRLKNYKEISKDIDVCLNFSDREKNEFINKEFDNLVKHFVEKNTFYKKLVSKVKGDYFKNLPLITKGLLKSTLIDNRTIKKYALGKYNTGGTSGNPLAFFVEKDFYAKEWAHMHYMWKKLGYRPSDTKITIRGKNVNSLYKYNFNQNEFLIDSYANFNSTDLKTLLSVFKKYNTQFIHGYPSAIYNFLKRVEKDAPNLFDFLQKNIKGIMFSSEYPLPLYRDYIENVLTRNTISWYGHTEGVILAGELSNKYEYVPFLSYGFTEAIKIDGYYHLVGTSFRNLAAPFIRYDTEDLIEPFFSKSGILEKFKIKEGRLGEFIIDKNNHKVSLTGMFFGRHHEIYNYINFIQVKQTSKGKATIYIYANETIEDPQKYFDARNINLEINFIQEKEPYRTLLGKTPLLIK